MRRRGGRRTTAAGHLIKGVGLGVALPMASFLIASRLWGLGGAVGVAVGTTAVCQLVRKLGGRPVSKLLALGLLETVIRSSLAMAFHSVRLYFLVPSVLTVATGFGYAWLGLRRRSAIKPLVAEVIPEQLLDRYGARLEPLITTAAVLYGGEQVAVGCLSFTLALTLRPSMYVVLHPLVSWSLLGLTAVTAYAATRNRVSYK